MPSNQSARLAALTVAAVCSAASTVVLTTPAHAETAAVHDVQGTTRTSPYAGQAVTGVAGIVTGVRAYGSSKGFWIQDPNPDADPATSEGVFVFTSSAPKAAVGDSVTVTGTVSEFVPGGAATGNQSITEITRPTVTVLSGGNAVPAAAVVNAKSVPAAYAPAGDPAAGDSVNGLTLEPKKYALDHYESLEGMNVQVADARVVTATDPYTELWVTVKPRENATRRGGTLYGSYASQNTGRLQIQSLGATADFNDFEFSGTARLLEGDGALWSAIKSLPRSERYTYDYQGNQQVLDQILVSPSIRRGCDFEYDSVHINSEFHDQISDHDPQVLRFEP